jgi:hypothetical protein
MRESTSQVTILLSTTPRAWRWRAELNGRRLAGGSGIFARALTASEAISYAKIKAQKWLIENGLREAEIVITAARGDFS